VSLLKITKDFVIVTLSHLLLSPDLLSSSIPGPLFCTLNHPGTSFYKELWNLQLCVYLQLCKAFLIVQETMTTPGFKTQLCWTSRHVTTCPNFL